MSKGIVGCDKPDLVPGSVIATGHNLELRLVVVRKVTLEEAKESSIRSTGQELTGVVEGETFYEVEATHLPVGSDN